MCFWFRNGYDSQKTGYQSDACNSCFSLGGFAEAVESKSSEGVRRWSDFDSADGFDGFDGVDVASMALMDAPMASVDSMASTELSSE